MAQLRKDNSLRVADEVLKEVKKLLKPLSNKLTESLWIEAYSNGREQGYAIAGMVYVEEVDKGYDRMSITISFAENRRSDEIVVYFGQPGEYFGQGNTPSERAWEERQNFGNGKAKQAAKAIVKYIVNVQPTWLRK